jgi:photosystem II stability/assembly factor-like uncharacterized protein
MEEYMQVSAKGCFWSHLEEGNKECKQRTRYAGRVISSRIQSRSCRSRQRISWFQLTLHTISL